MYKAEIRDRLHDYKLSELTVEEKIYRKGMSLMAMAPFATRTQCHPEAIRKAANDILRFLDEI